eukprot:2308436-Prymnesium_polylepis.1
MLHCESAPEASTLERPCLSRCLETGYAGPPLGMAVVGPCWSGSAAPPPPRPPLRVACVWAARDSAKQPRERRRWKALHTVVNRICFSGPAPAYRT